MPKPLSRLESLPTELLQKIATFTPPSTIIALARVSWTIHDAAYDAQVLHTHFRGQTWAKKYLLARNVPVGVLARYAVADELTSSDSVGSFTSKQADVDGDLSDPLRKAMSYLPCLAMLGYEHIGVWKENYTTSAWGVDGGLASQKSSIGVFMACCFIREAENPVAGAFVNAEEFHNNRVWDIHNALHQTHPIGTAESIRNQCLLGVGNLAFLLSYAIEQNKIGPGLPITVVPPKLSQFPSLPSSVSDIPLPFAQDPAGEWSAYLQTVCRDMAHPDQLCTGTWQGYYSYYGGASQFDGPMTGIRFIERPESEGGFIEGSGTDSINNFTFGGTMSEDGRLSGLKGYPTHAIQWHLSMTPFGLYGLWTEGDGGNFMMLGAVWLWKKEWTDG